jgi:hypothetical protein
MSQSVVFIWDGDVSLLCAERGGCVEQHLAERALG